MPIQLQFGKKIFYAVATGLQTGIYETPQEANRLVTNITHNKSQKFRTREEAQLWLERHFHINGHVLDGVHRCDVV